LSLEGSISLATKEEGVTCIRDMRSYSTSATAPFKDGDLDIKPLGSVLSVQGTKLVTGIRQ